jgi:hypothetical protein
MQQLVYDVAMFDQKGCMSPQFVFVLTDSWETTEYFSKRFAQAWAEIERKLPSGHWRESEIAALQQSMAKYYLRNADLMGQIGGRLDKYFFENVFKGSDRDFNSYKYGVINLANACLHLESKGFRVFFPPARLDARNQIDLVCVEETAMAEFEYEVNEFFTRGYSIEDLSSIDPALAAHVYVTQVKSRGNLAQTYKDISQEGSTLTDVIQAQSLSESHFDELDADIIEKTRVSTNELKGVTSNQSRAVVYTCPPVRGRSFVYRSGMSDNMHNELGRSEQKFRDDTREAIAFAGQAVHSVAKAYIYVEELDGHRTSTPQSSRSFY